MMVSTDPVGLDATRSSTHHICRAIASAQVGGLLAPVARSSSLARHGTSHEVVSVPHWLGSCACGAGTSGTRLSICASILDCLGSSGSTRYGVAWGLWLI